MLPLVFTILLINTVALGPAPDSNPATISEKQRNLLVRPLVRQANECIAHRVVTDERYKRPAMDIGDLIVDALTDCVDRIRTMVDSYDRYFEDGSGAEFFAGSYLKALPDAVNELTRDFEVQ